MMKPYILVLYNTAAINPVLSSLTSLPIKNNKYAKDLVEVHLSDRSLNQLECFDDFPNLEVIWLNNNKVSACFED